jgi:hypothetical protein
LTIDPTLVNRLEVKDVNLGELKFHQQINIEDQGTRLALIAIMQEIESPGLNGRLDVDTLLIVAADAADALRVQFCDAARTCLRQGRPAQLATEARS